MEGLLFYLSVADVRGLLDKIDALTVPGSLLGLDLMNRNMLFSPGAWPQLAALARRGARGRFETNDPESLLARHGWEARVTQPGEEGADFAAGGPARWSPGGCQASREASSSGPGARDAGSSSVAFPVGAFRETPLRLVLHEIQDLARA